MSKPKIIPCPQCGQGMRNNHALGHAQCYNLQCNYSKLHDIPITEPLSENSQDSKEDSQNNQQQTQPAKCKCNGLIGHVGFRWTCDVCGTSYSG